MAIGCRRFFVYHRLLRVAYFRWIRSLFWDETHNGPCFKRRQPSYFVQVDCCRWPLTIATECAGISILKLTQEFRVPCLSHDGFLKTGGHPLVLNIFEHNCPSRLFDGGHISRFFRQKRPIFRPIRAGGEWLERATCSHLFASTPTYIIPIYTQCWLVVASPDFWLNLGDLFGIYGFNI